MIFCLLGIKNIFCKVYLSICKINITFVAYNLNLLCSYEIEFFIAKQV